MKFANRIMCYLSCVKLFCRSLDEQKQIEGMESASFNPLVYQGSSHTHQLVPGKKYEFLLACPQLRNSMHYLEYDDSEIDEFLDNAQKHEVKIMKSPVGSGTSIASTSSGDVAGPPSAAVAAQPRMLSTCSISEIKHQVENIRSHESVESVKRKAEEHEETRRQLAITLSEVEKYK